MAVDLTKTLQVIKNRQWVLGDIDWDAPGAEVVSPEQREKFKPFMADLMWIEFVGARGFAALARNAPTNELREIYTYFHAEEQRHANAELALMRRWGMLDGDVIPEPNVTIKHTMDALERYADSLPFPILATFIPLLETGLDGALLKFLLEEVTDPVCHQVFAKVNNDESRHLAVGFHVMGMIGHVPFYKIAVEFLGVLVRVRAITLPGLIALVPLVTRMIDNLGVMGLSQQRILDALNRFNDAGDRDPDVAAGSMYKIFRVYARWVVSENKLLYWFSRKMLKIADRMPQSLNPKPSSWLKELTDEPVH